MNDLTSEQIQAILDGAPEGAIEYCFYDYGDSIYPLYLNCENQFYEIEEKEWVDMGLVDNYFHSRARLSDLREILILRQQVKELEQREVELSAHVERLQESMSSLQQSSAGVAELHMSGEIADWASLRKGGKFEYWLMVFDESPATSLNAVQREAFVVGFMVSQAQFLNPSYSEAVGKANQHYPDKEQQK